MKFGAILCILFVVAGSNLAVADSGSLAPGEPTILPSTEYVLLPEGATVIWRDLINGKKIEERVEHTEGLLVRSRIDGERSFAYLPDPWSDNENTRQDDIASLFPLVVGKKVTFSRHERAGLAHDTVEVVRAERLGLPLGKVDTFVIQTKSEIASAGWTGEATFWYAPSLKWYVQLSIKDSDGDQRRRQVVEIKGP